MNYWWEGGLVFFHFVFHSLFFYSQVYCSTSAKIEKIKLLTLLFTTLSFSRLSSEYQYDFYFFFKYMYSVIKNSYWTFMNKHPIIIRLYIICLYCKTCLIWRGLVLKIFTWYDNIQFVGHCCILISHWLAFYINNHIHNITT